MEIYFYKDKGVSEISDTMAKKWGGISLRAPVEEYKECPHCGKKLGRKEIADRLQKKPVKCPKCKELIMPGMVVY